MVVAVSSERKVHYFNTDRILQMGGNQPDFTVESPLKYQTRYIQVFPDARGYAISSIEGRVGIKYVDINNPQQKDQSDFNFKCHRSSDNPPDAYSGTPARSRPQCTASRSTTSSARSRRAAATAATSSGTSTSGAARRRRTARHGQSRRVNSRSAVRSV